MYCRKIATEHFLNNARQLQSTDKAYNYHIYYDSINTTGYLIFQKDDCVSGSIRVFWVNFKHFSLSY